VAVWINGVPIVQELLGQTDLSGEDRGFAVDPFYGALRNLTLLDFTDVARICIE